MTPVADLPLRASLRTAVSGDLYVPRTCRKFGDRAFAVAAPRVWNSLPTDIKLHRSTTTSFKRCLQGELSLEYRQNSLIPLSMVVGVSDTTAFCQQEWPIFLCGYDYIPLSIM